jgi:hypothetical protein
MVPSESLGEMLRIGGHVDGAYVIPLDLVGISACFSPGTANRKAFEDELSDLYSIPSHMMDASSDVEKFKTPLKSGQTFLKKWLSHEESEPDTMSLAAWVERLAPGRDDLLLQMDIEGAEYKNIGQAEPNLVRRFRIIVIELHGLAQLARNPQAFLEEKGPLFSRLMRDHVVVHAHPNNCCGSTALEEPPMSIPNVLELTLLRRDRLEEWQNGALFQSPSPLDIGWNVRSKPPLFLTDGWIPESQRHESAVRREAIMAAWEHEALLDLLKTNRESTERLIRLSSWNGWPRSTK